MTSIVIQDACVLINLLAGGRFEEMAGGCGLRFAITQAVAREAMVLHNVETGEREWIDLQVFIEKGILETLAADNEQEKLRFIELTLSLDDGEAESVAIAEARHFALATDARKARNLIEREGLKIELWSTCSLLQHWQRGCFVPDRDLKTVITNIASRARYRPKMGHPDYDWWMKLVSG